MKKLLVALLVTLPLLAKADPLVQCLSGCDKNANARALAIGTTPADVWWLGPGVGLSVASRDSRTGTWNSGITFNFNYGIHWSPSFWKVSNEFMSFNLGLAAGNPTAFTGGGYYSIVLAPQVAFFNLISVGYGPSFNLGTTAGQQTNVSGVLFLGLSTAFGGP